MYLLKNDKCGFRLKVLMCVYLTLVAVSRPWIQFKFWMSDLYEGIQMRHIESFQMGHSAHRSELRHHSDICK